MVNNHSLRLWAHTNASWWYFKWTWYNCIKQPTWLPAAAKLEFEFPNSRGMKISFSLDTSYCEISLIYEEGFEFNTQKPKNEFSVLINWPNPNLRYRKLFGEHQRNLELACLNWKGVVEWGFGGSYGWWPNRYESNKSPIDSRLPLLIPTIINFIWILIPNSRFRCQIADAFWS